MKESEQDIAADFHQLNDELVKDDKQELSPNPYLLYRFFFKKICPIKTEEIEKFIADMAEETGDHPDRVKIIVKHFMVALD